MDGHDEYLLLMSLALDEEAAPVELDRLHAHLRTCPACAQAWEAWARLDRQLSSAPMIAPPPDLGDKVIARVRQAVLTSQRRTWLGWGAWAGAISLATGLIFWGALAFLWFEGQLIVAGDALLSWLAAFWLLVRGLITAVASIGVPALASALVTLSVVTCALGLLWLWLLVRRDRFSRVTLVRS